MNIQTDIKSAVEKAIHEAQIPAQHHLKLMGALQKHVNEGNKDRQEWKQFLHHHLQQMDLHKAHTEQNSHYIDSVVMRMEEQLDAHHAEVERLKDIKKGEDGKDGISPVLDHDKVIKEVLQRIPVPKNEVEITDEVLEAVTKRLTDPKKPLLTTAHLKDIAPFTQRMQSAINQNSQGFSFNGKRYKFEELLHGGGAGGGGGFGLITITGVISDTNTSFSTTGTPVLLNINGAEYQKTGGAITWTQTGTSITLSSPVGTGGSIFGIGGGTTSGGGGSSTGYQTAAGTVNGINPIFTFATAPNAISVDQGRVMQKVSSDGTINWTGSATVVLTVAPTFDIFGVA